MYPEPPNKQRSEYQEYPGFFRRDLEHTRGGPGIPLQHLESSVGFMSLFEEAYSENHSGWYRLRGETEDKGGPFFVLRNKCEPEITPVYSRKNMGPYWANPDYHLIETYSGWATPCNVDRLKYPPPIHSTEKQMNMWGAEAVAKAAPGTSPMNLATSLGELKKDGLPSMIGATFRQRSSAAKKAGDEYLNAQFGWAPLLRDVKSLARTVTSADDILRQLERDSGRKVRRRLTLFEKDEFLGIDDLGYVAPTVSGIRGGNIVADYPAGELRCAVRQYRKVWFSGAFTYYLPSDYYSRNAVVRGAARARVLLGLTPSPEVLWNLAPWSWAADWFSNAGEVISNTQRFLTEGLVMHHGYLMEHTINRHTYWCGSNNSATVSLITETKGRVKANPFGFGVEWPDLNGFQQSILVALGLSRRG